MDDSAPLEPATIVVDVNEPDDIAQILDALNMDVRRQRLAPADYVVGPIALERKSVGDFLSSLNQKRLFEQVSRLKEAYPPPVGLILEGDLTHLHDLREPRSFWGALLAIGVDMDVRVIPTASRAQTAEMLSVLAFRVARQWSGRGGTGVRYKPVTMTETEQQKFVVQGLPGIGDTTSDALLAHFGSLRRLLAATERDLLRVPGIGKKRAAEMTALLDRPYAAAQRRLAADEE